MGRPKRKQSPPARTASHSPVRTPNVTVNPTPAKSVNIPIKPYIVERLAFTGDENDLSVMDFISNVKAIAEQHSADWSAIKHVLLVAFKKSARLWLSTVMNRITSLSEFLEIFKKVYLGSDYAYNLNLEIKNRKQAPGETLTQFIARQRYACEMLPTTISDEDFVEIIW